MNELEKNQDFYWKVLHKNIEWIKFSESKLIFSLTICATIVGTIGLKHDGLSDLASNHPWPFGVGCISVICVGISAATAFIGLDPNLSNENGKSLVYFGHIAKNSSSADNYLKESLKMLESADSIEIQLSHQVHVTSGIAWKKFKFATYSLRFLFGAICLALFSSLIAIFS